MRFVTGKISGIGGSYKQCPEDFFVEEIPLYPCSGHGEHLYLQIEKRGLTTNEMLRRIASSFKLSEREIGYAGLKDAQAVTRQWISVPANCEKNLTRLDQLPLKILASNRHDNKLRLGHLAGNRFRLRIANPVTSAKERADQIFEQLQQHGVPNRFGEQRYGLLGNSHRLGQLLITGNYPQFCHELIGDPERIVNQEWKRAAELFRAGEFSAAVRQLPPRMQEEKRLIGMLVRGQSSKSAVLSLPKRLLRLYLSALQSWMFDQLLQQRMPKLWQLQDGDLAIKHANGACFLVEDSAIEQPRADCFEISPTAPLFGSKLKLAEQTPGKNELATLEQVGLRPESWKLGNGLTMSGERRALRVPISAISTTEIAKDLQLDFCLPRGSYATSVLSEVLKNDPPTVVALYNFESD